MKDDGSHLDFHFVNTKNVNVRWLAGATTGIPPFMKNDKAHSKDSSLNNPSYDERVIPRWLRSQLPFSHLIIVSIVGSDLFRPFDPVVRNGL
jgi:hypothetical protein